MRDLITAASQARSTPSAIRSDRAGAGFVAVEFDLGGTVLSDGRLYEDREIAEKTVSERNDFDALTGVLERWYVLQVCADTPEAAHAVRVAHALRSGVDQRASR